MVNCGGTVQLSGARAWLCASTLNYQRHTWNENRNHPCTTVDGERTVDTEPMFRLVLDNAELSGCGLISEA